MATKFVSKNSVFTSFITAGDVLDAVLDMAEPIRSAVFDFRDKSTLFQDAALSIPVTSYGQTVAGVRDRTGNQWTLTQPVAGARPVFQASPDGIDGLYFDGSDDFLLFTADSSGHALFAGAAQVNTFLSARRESQLGSDFAFPGIGGGPLLNAQAGDAVAVKRAGPDAQTIVTTSNTTGATRVRTVRIKAEEGICNAYVDDQSASSANLPSAGPLANTAHTGGRLGNYPGSGNYFQGYIHEAVIVTSEISDDQARIISRMISNHVGVYP